MWWKFAITAWLIFASCASKDGRGNTLHTLDSNAAIQPSSPNLDDIVVQTFTKTPRNIEGCRGLFVKREDSLTMQPYVFVSNLKGISFIRLNERLMELRLIKQANTDSLTVNELYANEEAEVELRIKQIQTYSDDVWDYEGVLIIRKKSKRKVIQIWGKLGC